MTERSIIFSAPMVRALLDGSKTQTRRMVKPQFNDDAEPTEMGATNERGHQMVGHSGMWWDDGAGNHETAVRCPYGQPRDRLWVREAFDFFPAGGADQPQACEIVYWATGSIEPREAPLDYNPMIYSYEKVRPSIHMPRWASRITLKITGVRVERVQDISDTDCAREGITAKHCTFAGGWKEAYSDLWETINGPNSWRANPWVWVVEFKVVKP